jgi:hypothetical protein
MRVSGEIGKWCGLLWVGGYCHFQTEVDQQHFLQDLLSIAHIVGESHHEQKAPT